MDRPDPQPSLSIGPSDFLKLRNLGVLYVDKTDFIARVLADPAKTLLLPRPRRFGKTTNLSTLRYFVEKTAEDRTPLFADLAVWQSAAARQHFQKHPVIFLTFKDVKQATWESCAENLAELFAGLYTGSDDLIRELVFRQGGQGGDEGDMEALLAGQGIRKEIQENIVLRDIYRQPDALWSFLLLTGYLKAAEVTWEDGIPYGVLMVPNREVALVFRKLFASWLEQGLGGKSQVEQMGRALLSGDLVTFERHLTRLLVDSGSYYDAAGNAVKMLPEAMYHAFILALLLHLQPRYRVRSNREAGYGRYDLMLLPAEAGQPGVVLELKVKQKGETLTQAVARAAKQLRDKDYAAELRAVGAAPIHQVAVAFDGKKVQVRSADASAAKAPSRRRKGGG